MTDADASATHAAGWREAAMWAAAVSVLFMVVYGATNTVAAMRSDVPTLYLPWELKIPLVPVMIVPYMSIDMFFVLSFFVCTQRKELRTHSMRLILAIVVAGLFFALFPLRLGFERTPVGGFFGPAFALLHSFDQPHNLAPSLHIALRSILWFVYVRHTEGLLNGAVRVWFILIGLSTILTHQHHLIDIVTGQMLALWCFYIVPDEGVSIRPRRPRLYSRALGRRYAVGSAVLAVVGVATWPWGGILMWPAFSLLMVSLGYYGLGPAMFRKTDGRLPLSARFWLAPYLLGTQVVQAWLLRGTEPCAKVAPGVYIGRRLSRRDAAMLRSLGVGSVLDLTAEYSSPDCARGLQYVNVPLLDMAAPTPQDLARCVEHVQQQCGRGVYIHCALGLGRSALVAAAYLLASGQAANTEEAVAMVRRVRPSLKLSPQMMEALAIFETAEISQPL